MDAYYFLVWDCLDAKRIGVSQVVFTGKRQAFEIFLAADALYA